MDYKKPEKCAATHLYKYCKFNHARFEQIVLRNELYIPTVDQLNDPSEGRPVLSKTTLNKLINFLYLKFIENNPYMPLSELSQQRNIIECDTDTIKLGQEQIMKILSDRLDNALSTTRIYSMSKRCDKMNLWASYAANHEGLCLEFSNSGLFSETCEVIYCNEAEMDITNSNQITSYFLYYKNTDWSNEEEVRLVFPRISYPEINFSITPQD
jgi:hypothetical protein